MTLQVTDAGTGRRPWHRPRRPAGSATAPSSASASRSA